MANRSMRDNSQLEAKLDLRRHFLSRYHSPGPASVFDACAGGGLLWSILGKEFPCLYWGVDKKPKPGRLAVESERILALPGFAQDVVDIDTYGFPWAHWAALLPNVTRPTTVFLTYGHVHMLGGGRGSNVGLRTMGIVFSRPVPFAIRELLEWSHSLPHYFALPFRFGLDIVEAVESLSANPHMRFFGFHLSPKKSS